MRYYHFPGVKPAGLPSAELAAGGQPLTVDADGICVAFPKGNWSVLHTGYYWAAGAEVSTTAWLFWKRGVTLPVLALHRNLALEPGRDELIVVNPVGDGTNAIVFAASTGLIDVQIRPGRK